MARICSASKRTVSLILAVCKLKDGRQIAEKIANVGKHIVIGNMRVLVCNTYALVLAEISVSFLGICWATTIPFIGRYAHIWNAEDSSVVESLLALLANLLAESRPAVDGTTGKSRVKGDNIFDAQIGTHS